MSGGRVEPFDAPARIVLFGFDSTDATLRIRPRPKHWRVVGAAQRAGLGLVVAPVVGLVPPHAPWAIGALAVGGLLARRRWNERFTVEALDGRCPKCGSELSIQPGRLQRPHPVSCENCHHDSSIEVDDAVLEAHVDHGDE